MNHQRTERKLITYLCADDGSGGWYTEIEASSAQAALEEYISILSDPASPKGEEGTRVRVHVSARDDDHDRAEVWYQYGVKEHEVASHGRPPPTTIQSHL